MACIRKPPDRILDIAFPVPVLVRGRRGGTKIFLREGRTPALLRGVRRSELEQRGAGMVRYEGKLWSSLCLFHDRTSSYFIKTLQGRSSLERCWYSRFSFTLPRILDAEADGRPRAIPAGAAVVRDEYEAAAAAHARTIISEMFYEGALFYEVRPREGRIPGCPVRVTFEIHTFVHRGPMKLYELALEAAFDPEAGPALRPHLATLEDFALRGLVRDIRGEEYAGVADLCLRVASLLSHLHPLEPRRRRAVAFMSDEADTIRTLTDPNVIVPDADLAALETL